MTRASILRAPFGLARWERNRRRAQARSTGIDKVNCANFSVTYRSPIRSAFRRTAASPISQIPAKNIIWRVDTDPETGLPIGDPALFYQHKEKGGVDGSVVDGDGNVWNACWGRSSIDVYAPSGKRIRSIAMPVLQPSCPAFISEGQRQSDRNDGLSSHDGSRTSVGSRRRQDLPDRACR